jgi:hypothetical protein
VEGHDARTIVIPIPDNNHRPNATELAAAIEAALNNQVSKTFEELTERLSPSQKGKLKAATDTRPFPIDFKCLVRSGRLVIQCIVDVSDEVFNERLNGESFIQLPAISLTEMGLSSSDSKPKMSAKTNLCGCPRPFQASCRSLSSWNVCRQY